MDTINSRIKRIRKKLKMNQKDFGQKLGLTQSGISRIETPGTTVIEQNIHQIAALFHVNEHWLRTGEGDEFSDTRQDMIDHFSELLMLRPKERIFLQTFLDFKPDERELLLRFVETFARKYIKKLQQSSKTYPHLLSNEALATFKANSPQEEN